MSKINKIKTKDAFYFPHYCNARHDPKIRRVRKELGAEGYGIFFMILEVLRNESDHLYPVKDIDLLADEFVTSEQKVNAVVFNYDLFMKDNDGNFYSPKLFLYLQPFFEGKEKKRIAGIKGNLIKHGYYTSLELKGKSPKDILLLANEIDGFSHSDPISDRLPTAIKANETNETNEMKQIKSNETNKKSDSVFASYVSPEYNLPKNKILQGLISHWNSFDNLPRCKSTIVDLPRISEVVVKLNIHTEDEIKKAIETLSELYDDLSFGKTTSFSNFFANHTVDSWVPSANPKKAFKGISAASFTPDKWRGEQNFEF